jgi:hypothetical protein
MYWGVEVQLHAFLTSALDGGEWSASRPDRFTPKERVPGTRGLLREKRENNNILNLYFYCKLQNVRTNKFALSVRIFTFK